MGWACKRAEHLVRAAVDGDRLLRDGDAVLIGASGGADSLCLAYLLAQLNTHARRNWSLRAIHVDAGFPGSRPGRVVRAFRRAGVECESRAIDVPTACARSKENPCYVCSRERRKLLFRAAADIGAQKVALGHHLEDVNETFLMNLLCTSSGATLLTSQSLFKGALSVIRPLYYLDKKLIRACLRQAGLLPVRNHCPHSRDSTRLQLRRLLAHFEKRHPRAATNIFWGIHNLKPDYLPRRARAGRRPA